MDATVAVRPTSRGGVDALGVRFTLSLQRSEGSSAKATKGEAVVTYCESLATQDLESSDFCNDRDNTESSIKMRIVNILAIGVILILADHRHYQLGLPHPDPAFAKRLQAIQILPSLCWVWCRCSPVRCMQWAAEWAGNHPNLAWNDSIACRFIAFGLLDVKCQDSTLILLNIFLEFALRIEKLFTLQVID